MPLIEISDELYEELKRMADGGTAMMTISTGEPFTVYPDEIAEGMIWHAVTRLRQGERSELDEAVLF